MPGYSPTNNDAARLISSGNYQGKPFSDPEYSALLRLATVVSGAGAALILYEAGDRARLASTYGFNVWSGDVNVGQPEFWALSGTRHVDEIPSPEFQAMLRQQGFQYVYACGLGIKGSNLTASFFLFSKVCFDLNESLQESLNAILRQIKHRESSILTEMYLAEVLTKYDEVNTMFDSSAELHSVLDRDGKILSVNSVVSKLVGYSPKEVIGRPIWIFFRADDIQRMIPILELGLSEGRKSFELESRILLKNGGEKWIGWSVAVKNYRWYVNGRDITGQKAMLDELQQLSLVANKVNNGVVISDGQSRIIWINDAFEKITGYDLSDLKGSRLADKLAGPKTDMKIVEGARLRTRAKESFSVDLLVYRKDGEPIWLSIFNSVILDGEGNVDREVEVIIDITARKKAEEELETLSLVASQTSNGVILRDASGYITWANSAAENILGYSLPEMRGRRLAEFVATEDTDRSLFTACQASLEEKRPFRMDLLINKKGGLPIWIDSSITPILNDAGDVERHIEIITDITERKRSEEELTLLSLVASKTINGVAISSSDGRIKWVNSALEELTGYSLEDFKNTRPGDLLAGPGTDKDLLQKARQQAIDRKPSYIELLSYKKDGSPVWLAISNTPTFNKDGSLDQQVEIINDISERKLAEAELIKTREEALQLSKAKETFLSVMSHEIRTPLNAVIGMSHILMEDNPSESQVENLKILKFSAENLLTLINDILDFTKIETGNMSLESASTNLKQLVSQILNSLQFRTQGKDLTLRSEVNPRIPDFVLADHTRIYQILVNLLGNSIKFTDRGEVKLRVDIVSERPSDVEILFEVSDTGIGIEPEKIDYIFDSYTQASSDTTRKYGGTGLGLAITKRLLKLYNSEIRVKSEVGKGSSFSFVIKFKRSQISEMQTETSTTMDPIDAKILVVDDNEINRILAGKVLTKWGIRIEFAENGQIALEKVQTGNFDLVLMDLHMPVMDGMESAREIRALGGTYSDIPIVALTASLFGNELETIRECGMNGYVIKPFVPADLYARISTLLKASK